MSSDNIVNSRPVWRLVRVVEGARLESVYTGNCIKGSNPFVSAKTLNLAVLRVYTAKPAG